jgi:hypothetical protein
MTEANFDAITNNDFIRVRATGDAVFDEVTIFKLKSGESPVVGAVEATNGLAWTRAINGGAWTPAGTTTDLTATFYRGGSAIATRTVRATLNTVDGTIILSSVGNTGETTSQVFTGSGTTSTSVKFTHDASGADVVEGVLSVQGGNSGVDGVAPFTSFTGGVGAFTSADVLRENENGNGTPNDGEIGIDDSTWSFLDGTTYDTGGVLTLNTPYESTTRTANQFYVIVGATNADVRFGGSWQNHRFFIAELDSAAQTWETIANDNSTLAYVPLATDFIVGIGSRPSTGDAGIKFLSTVAHRINLDATSAPQFIQNAAITNALVGNLSATKITTDELVAARINIDGVTLGTSGDSLIVATGGIGTTQLGNDSVTTAKIAASQVTATEILAGTITAAEIATGTITANEMSANSINTSELIADSVTATIINNAAVTTPKINTDAVTQLGRSFTAGSIALPVGVTTWASVTVNPDEDPAPPLLIVVSCLINKVGGGTGTIEPFRLLRDSTELIKDITARIVIPAGETEVISFNYVDTATSSASRDYTVSTLSFTATGVEANHRFIGVYEIKR